MRFLYVRCHTCGDTDPGLSGHNTEVTDTYTIDYEASLQCNNSNPIAVIKSVMTFHEEPGVNPMNRSSKK
ncbi:hypothetical protein [Candidatus Neptunichlamydia sp. REUL1]|uniref:hypothetical protein n=1 Tax=Candidatus Neptunichlamydia sp. REUL1 TaxID=3064277 RepID=UPI0029317E73|nr:hypothetical protein [Candidatus Neptunochlamydia sp. REUL1]